MRGRNGFTAEDAEIAEGPAAVMGRFHPIGSGFSASPAASAVRSDHEFQRVSVVEGSDGTRLCANKGEQ